MSNGKSLLEIRDDSEGLGSPLPDKIGFKNYEGRYVPWPDKLVLVDDLLHFGLR